MSSFYGGGCIGGGGSGGDSSDYNDLKNTPIVNMTGSDEVKFVNMGGLDPGHYNLKGYYKEDSQGELKNAIQPIDMIVTIDPQKQKKMIHYFTLEDEVLYFNLIVYNKGLVEHVTKTPINGKVEADIYWGQIIA